MGANTTFPITFHDASTSMGNGNVFYNTGCKTLTIEIYGTSSTRTVTFYCKCFSGTSRAIQGVKISDFSTGVNTTGTGEVWQFDITGIDQIIMDLTAVSGGNVTIKGRAVA